MLPDPCFRLSFHIIDSRIDRRDAHSMIERTQEWGYNHTQGAEGPDHAPAQ